jgi:hypothetical protein
MPFVVVRSMKPFSSALSFDEQGERTKASLGVNRNFRLTVAPTLGGLSNAKFEPGFDAKGSSTVPQRTGYASHWHKHLHRRFPTELSVIKHLSSRPYLVAMCEPTQGFNIEAAVSA